YRITPDYNYRVEKSSHTTELIAYLNENPFSIFLDNFAMISNHEYFEPPKENEFRFDTTRIIAFDWANDNTDIKREFYNNPVADKVANGNRNSIHESLQAKLLADNYPVLIYDHGTGEIADFISIIEL